MACLFYTTHSRRFCLLVIGYHAIGPSPHGLCSQAVHVHSGINSLKPVSMLVSDDTCGMSVLYHAHSPLLFACDRVSRNRPITRTACDLRLRTFIEDSTASSLSACSYQSIHGACLFYTTHTRRFCLLAIGYHAIGPSLARLVISGCAPSLRTQQPPVYQHARIRRYMGHVCFIPRTLAAFVCL